MYIVHPGQQAFKDLLERVKTECGSAADAAAYEAVVVQPQIKITDEEKNAWREWAERGAGGFVATSITEAGVGQPAPGPGSLSLAIDFEDFCLWRTKRIAEDLGHRYGQGEFMADAVNNALNQEVARIDQLRDAFYQAMKLNDSAAATDEPQDMPGPPTPGPAETKIVRIHWKDACSVQGWHFQHEIEEQGLSLVESVGWLVGEDDSCVKLAISVSDGVAGNMTIIPKSGIVDRWEFKD